MSEANLWAVYTAIGHDVNLVARVCDKIDANKIWVTASTLEHVSKFGDFQVNYDVDAGNVKVLNTSEETKMKGISHPVEVYCVSRKSGFQPVSI